MVAPVEFRASRERASQLGEADKAVVAMITLSALSLGPAVLPSFTSAIQFLKVAMDRLNEVLA